MTTRRRWSPAAAACVSTLTRDTRHRPRPCRPAARQAPPRPRSGWPPAPAPQSSCNARRSSRKRCGWAAPHGPTAHPLGLQRTGLSLLQPRSTAHAEQHYQRNPRQSIHAVLQQAVSIPCWGSPGVEGQQSAVLPNAPFLRHALQMASTIVGVLTKAGLLDEVRGRCGRGTRIPWPCLGALLCARQRSRTAAVRGWRCVACAFYDSPPPQGSRCLAETTHSPAFCGSLQACPHACAPLPAGRLLQR